MSKNSKSRRKMRASTGVPTKGNLPPPRRLAPAPASRSPAFDTPVARPPVAPRPDTASVSGPVTASSSSAPGATGSSPRAAGLEEAFFREGHSTFPPLSLDFDTDLPHLEPAPSRHADPHAVARRARLRRVFAGVMGFASVLTVVITAKALARHAGAAAAPMGTELTAPQPIVASIDLDAPPAAEHVARKTKGQRATGATPTGPLEFNASRARRQPTW